MTKSLIDCTDSEQSVATPNSRQEVLYQPKFETTPRAIESAFPETQIKLDYSINPPHH